MIDKIDYSKMDDKEFEMFLNDIGIDSNDIKFNQPTSGVIFSEEKENISYKTQNFKVSISQDYLLAS